MQNRTSTAAEVFAEVVKLPATDRPRALERLCGGDASLRGCVEMILMAHDGAAGFSPSAGAEVGAQLAARIDESATSARPLESSNAVERTLREGVGAHVGPYKLLQQLGEGGFGVVYLAEQDRPVRRRVAVKVIKPGMDTRGVIARFEAERQTLAMMDHPLIAKVLDVGATDAGNPYFAMEYIRGEPITRVCDRHRLGIDDRLRLFAQVCGGVQHAHTKGVIHRDLKPSNILAAIDEGAPGIGVTPRIIDFGISKALIQPLTDRTLFTERGQLIGTPEYMSPEQAEMTSLDIDTRSDIYSLGVLLYELLTGALPFESMSLRAGGLAEIQRIIRDVEPARPSTRITELSTAASASSAPAIAHNRRIDVNVLRRRLRGDLDWIVMKCLEKDRTRRYATANDLAADVQRHLANEPVLAGPPSARYRLGKFVRRNRGGVLAAGLVAAALVAGVIGTGLGLLNAVQARGAELEQSRIAESEAKKAANEAAIALAVNQFLNEDLLSAAKPSEQGIDVTMREVLAVAASRIDERFRDQPLVEAAIRGTLGTTYVALGKYDLAEPHLERALDLRRRTLDDGDAATLESMDDLGKLRRRQARYAEAEALFAAVLDARRRALGEDDPLTLASTNNLAVMYVEAGRLAEAEPLYKATLERRLRLVGPDHVTTLRTMNNLGALYRRMGRYDDAQPIYVSALEARRRTLGDLDPSTLIAINNLAALYIDQRRPADAAPLLEEAIEGQRRILSPDHPDTLSTLQNLAALRVAEERHDEAEESLRALLEARRRVLAVDHPDTLTTMNSLASVLNALGRWEESLDLVADALVAARRSLPAGTTHVGLLLCTRGSALTGLGRHADAESALLEAHESLVASLGPRHPRVARCAELLAELYDAWGKPEQAAIWQAPTGRGH